MDKSGPPIHYLMFQLNVVSEVSSVAEALSTNITGMFASCKTHPPSRTSSTLKSSKYSTIGHLPFDSVFVDAKGFPCSNNSNLVHLF